MATVKEIMSLFSSKSKKFAHDAETEKIVKDHIHDEYTKKLNHVERLQRLCKEAKIISFLVKVNKTEHDRQVHAVMLKDAIVKITAEKNYVITGRDLEEELKLDIKNGVDEDKLSIIKKREKDTVIRSYRIDNIIRGSINWN